MEAHHMTMLLLPGAWGLSMAGLYVFLAADGTPSPAWPEFGLIGVVLGMVFWLLKQFFESTMAQQRELTVAMGAIRDTAVQTAALLARLEERMVRHMAADEKVDQQILRGLRSCHPEVGNVDEGDEPPKSSRKP